MLNRPQQRSRWDSLTIIDPKFSKSLTRRGIIEALKLKEWSPRKIGCYATVLGGAIFVYYSGKQREWIQEATGWDNTFYKWSIYLLQPTVAALVATFSQFSRPQPSLEVLEKRFKESLLLSDLKMVDEPLIRAVNKDIRLTLEEMQQISSPARSKAIRQKNENSNPPRLGLKSSTYNISVSPTAADNYSDCLQVKTTDDKTAITEETKIATQLSFLSPRAVYSPSNHVKIDIHESIPISSKSQILLTPYILNQRALNIDIAIIIFCHKSEDDIEAFIKAALRHVDPSQIFVIDSGRSDLPLDNTEEIIRKRFALDRGYLINYIWMQHAGNKNRVEYVGAKAALEKGYEFILTLDNTQIPDNVELSDMRKPIDRSDKKGTCKGVYPPLIPVSSRANDSNNPLIGFQRISHYQSDLGNSLKSRLGGPVYPHNGASLWLTRIYIEALKTHNYMFYADDGYKGLLIYSFGYTLQLYNKGAFFITKAPTSLFGEHPNYYEQNIQPSLMGSDIYFTKFAYTFLTSWTQSSLAAKFVVKAIQLYEAYTLLTVPLKVMLFTSMGKDPDFWFINAMFLAFSVFTPAMLKTRLAIQDRANLTIKWEDVALSPLFQIGQTALNVLSFVPAGLVYWPNRKNSLTALAFEDKIAADPTLLAKIRREPLLLLTVNKLIAAEHKKLPPRIRDVLPWFYKLNAKTVNSPRSLTLTDESLHTLIDLTERPQTDEKIIDFNNIIINDAPSNFLSIINVLLLSQIISLENADNDYQDLYEILKRYDWLSETLTKFTRFYKDKVTKNVTEALLTYIQNEWQMNYKNLNLFEANANFKIEMINCRLRLSQILYRGFNQYPENFKKPIQINFTDGLLGVGRASTAMMLLLLQCFSNFKMNYQIMLSAADLKFIARYETVYKHNRNAEITYNPNFLSMDMLQIELLLGVITHAELTDIYASYRGCVKLCSYHFEVNNPMMSLVHHGTIAKPLVEQSIYEMAETGDIEEPLEQSIYEMAETAKNVFESHFKNTKQAVDLENLLEDYSNEIYNVKTEKQENVPFEKTAALIDASNNLVAILISLDKLSHSSWSKLKILGQYQSPAPDSKHLSSTAVAINPTDTKASDSKKGSNKYQIFSCEITDTAKYTGGFYDWTNCESNNAKPVKIYTCMQDLTKAPKPSEKRIEPALVDFVVTPLSSKSVFSRPKSPSNKPDSTQFQAPPFIYSNTG